MGTSAGRAVHEKVPRCALNPTRIGTPPGPFTLLKAADRSVVRGGAANGSLLREGERWDTSTQAVGRCTAEVAFTLIRTASMTQNRKLADLDASFVTGASGQVRSR